MSLKDGTPEQVRAETDLILRSGRCEGSRFVLRKGHNLAVRTHAGRQ